MSDINVLLFLPHQDLFISIRSFLKGLSFIRHLHPFAKTYNNIQETLLNPCIMMIGAHRTDKVQVATQCPQHRHREIDKIRGARRVTRGRRPARISN